MTLSGATNAQLATDPTAMGVIENDDDPPRVSFGAALYSVDEGGSVEVTVVLSAPSGRPEVVVPLTHEAQGGATPQGENGADYAGVPESVTFRERETEYTFTIRALADADADTGESVVLRFGPRPPSVWPGGTPAEATVTIMDNDEGPIGPDGDDPKPTLSVEDAETAEGAEGAVVEFTVTLSERSRTR